jgi:hypothetical protein
MGESLRRESILHQVNISKLGIFIYVVGKGYLIRGKGFSLTKYLITVRSWFVKGIHHKVKVAR